MQATDMAPIPVSGVTGLVTYLMPQGLKLVPLPLIALVLILYVAVIGPLDYLVLGRLRLRRFTWLTFPAVTLGFTAFALLISNRYMRTADHRAGITFRDVAEGGRVARENRLEILFPSTSRQMVTEVPRGLFMPLRFQDFGQGMMWMYGPYGYPQWNETRATPALLDGRMPSAFRAVQLVPQWTPQLNRILTIPLQETQTATANFDWDQVPDFGTPGADGALAERIRTAFGHDVTVWLYHGYEVKTLMGDSDLLSRGSNWEQVYLAGQFTQRQADFVKDVCAPLQPGFFAVVSELAPTGGDRFDDMALLDPTDERQWALAIAVPETDALVIYRRRYIREASKP
jgi:hypothetical protein